MPPTKDPLVHAVRALSTAMGLLERAKDFLLYDIASQSVRKQKHPRINDETKLIKEIEKFLNERR